MTACALLMDVRYKLAGHQAGAYVLVSLGMSFKNWCQDIDTRVGYLDVSL